MSRRIFAMFLLSALTVLGTAFGAVSVASADGPPVCVTGHGWIGCAP
ncbi:hypothetical protein [Actinokineospora sp.]